MGDARSGMVRVMKRRALAIAVVIAAVVLFCTSTTACAPALRVDGVMPRSVAAGAALAITGVGFDDDLELSLEGAGVVVRLQRITVADDGHASGNVPPATPAGPYAVVARSRGQLARFDNVQVMRGGLRVHFLDVGQGDATLVVAPGGEALLIDGGPHHRGDDVKHALATLAGGRLDAVVLSHTDADHLGGLVDILAGPDGLPGTGDDRSPEQTFGYRDDGSCTSQLCDSARALRAWPFTAPVPGEPVALGDADVTVVAVDGDVGDGRVAGADDDNARSVVVRVRYGGRSVLITGDLTGGGMGYADLEGPLARKTGPVEVLRVAHHGSDTSSNGAALAAWGPRALVMSLGTDNAYCHPAPETLERLAATGATLVSTGSGMVSDAGRCRGPTSWPAAARVGLGDVTLEIDADGTLTLAGETL